MSIVVDPDTGVEYRRHEAGPFYRVENGTTVWVDTTGPLHARLLAAMDQQVPR